MFRNNVPISSNDHLDSDLLAGYLANEPIYVCTDALLNFSINYLESIDKPFTLLSGDSDIAITNNFINNNEIRKILESPKLVGWFAQNMIADHPKLHQLPIGMDYHTMWERPGTWGLTQQSPISQERALINTLSCAPDFLNRFFAGYCNWHFALDRGDRQDCLTKIDRKICLIEKNHLPRISSWQRQAKCMFVISPEGAGIDCHRTWEAILLGCIPVVRKNKFSVLFDRLPVLQLDDWSEFNSTTMIKCVNRFDKEKFDFNLLFLNHWASKINKKKPLNLPEMTIKEFKNFLCHESY